MNEKNRESRKARQGPSLLDEVLERRIALYVLAAGATLASGSAAQAKVVFTPSSAIVHEDTLHIDLNNDGKIDIVLLQYIQTGPSSIRSLGQGGKRHPMRNGPGPRCSSYCRFYMRASPGAYSNGNGIIDVRPAPPFLAAALRNGEKIGPSNPNFQVFGGIMASELIESGRNYGPSGSFLNVTNRFLGVEFLINGQVHYGWIGFRKANARGAKLLGWAYETQPNTPIIAGAGQGAVFPPSAELRSAGPENVPAVRAAEPTSLELLAAGHVAVADWRRRNAAVIVPVASPS